MKDSHKIVSSFLSEFGLDQLVLPYDKEAIAFYPAPAQGLLYTTQIILSGNTGSSPGTSLTISSPTYSQPTGIPTTPYILPNTVYRVKRVIIDIVVPNTATGPPVTIQLQLVPSGGPPITLYQRVVPYGVNVSIDTEDDIADFLLQQNGSFSLQLVVSSSSTLPADMSVNAMVFLTKLPAFSGSIE